MTPPGIFSRPAREYSRAERVDIHHLAGKPYYVPSLSTGVRADRRVDPNEASSMLILLGLGILWAAVLLPPVIRNRDVLTRPLAAVASVGRSASRVTVGSAARSAGRPRVGASLSGVRSRRLRAFRSAATSVPDDVGSARRRRRDLLLTLGGVAIFTFLGGVAVGGAVWMVHFLVDLLLVGYAMLVTQRHQLEAERRETVIPFRMDGPLMGGLTGTSAMRDEAVLSRRAN